MFGELENQMNAMANKLFDAIPEDDDGPEDVIPEDSNNENEDDGNNIPLSLTASSSHNDGFSSIKLNDLIASNTNALINNNSNTNVKDGNNINKLDGNLILNTLKQNSTTNLNSTSNSANPNSLDRTGDSDIISASPSVISQKLNEHYSESGNNDVVNNNEGLLIPQLEGIAENLINPDSQNTENNQSSRSNQSARSNRSIHSNQSNQNSISNKNSSRSSKSAKSKISASNSRQNSSALQSPRDLSARSTNSKKVSATASSSSLTKRQQQQNDASGASSRPPSSRSTKSTKSNVNPNEDINESAGANSSQQSSARSTKSSSRNKSNSGASSSRSNNNNDRQDLSQLIQRPFSVLAGITKQVQPEENDDKESQNEENENVNQIQPDQMDNQIQPDDMDNQIQPDDMDNQVKPDDMDNQIQPDQMDNQIKPDEIDNQIQPDQMDNQINPDEMDNQIHLDQIDEDDEQQPPPDNENDKEQGANEPEKDKQIENNDEKAEDNDINKENKEANQEINEIKENNGQEENKDNNNTNDTNENPQNPIEEGLNVTDENPTVPSIPHFPKRTIYDEEELESRLREFIKTKGKSYSRIPVDMRNQLFQHILRRRVQSIENQDYDTGEKLMTAQENLRNLMNKDMIESEETNEESLNAGRLSDAKYELKTATEKWDQAMKDLNYKLKDQEDQLISQQQRELQELAEFWQDPSKFHEFNKASSQLLTMREIEKNMALTGDFQGAKIMKKRALALEKKETIEAQKRAQEAMEQSFQSMKTKHTMQLNAHRRLAHKLMVQEEVKRDYELQPLRMAVKKYENYQKVKEDTKRETKPQFKKAPPVSKSMLVKKTKKDSIIITDDRPPITTPRTMERLVRLRELKRADQLALTKVETKIVLKKQIRDLNRIKVEKEPQSSRTRNTNF